MPKYDAAAASALALISSKGGPVKIVREVKSGFDPVTQAQTTARGEYPFQAVCLPAGKSAEVRIGSLENRNVVEAYLAMKGAAIEPRPGDVLQFAGKDWRILWTTTYNPAGDGAILTTAYAEA